MLAMFMYASNPTGNKNMDANLHKCLNWVQQETIVKKTALRMSRNRIITIEAKNMVAETVVAPFPLVATWKAVQNLLVQLKNQEIKMLF